MQQQKLLTHNDIGARKSVHLHHIRAHFVEIASAIHEVVVEINSQKFLVRIKAGLKKFEQFEVLAVRGCVELCLRTVRLLRKIVTSLYFEY
jgi:hypothetical protein